MTDDSDLFVLTLTPGQFAAWGASVKGQEKLRQKAADRAVGRRCSTIEVRDPAGELLEQFYITLPEL